MELPGACLTTGRTRTWNRPSRRTQGGSGFPLLHLVPRRGGNTTRSIYRCVCSIYTHEAVVYVTCFALRVSGGSLLESLCTDLFSVSSS